MGTPVLEVEGLRKVFPGKGRNGRDLVAVDDVSFAIAQGECVGLVGESGCGKSTTAQMITRMIEPTSGSVRVSGIDVTHASGRQLREVYEHVQMVFQNPVASFDPRQTLGAGICEGLRNRGATRGEARTKAIELLGRCGLSPEYADRYPRQVSGGQCQRAAIARALAVGPDLIICDEATSALDMTVQAQVIDLLRCLREESETSYLFICHDLALAQDFCDRILVMRSGLIVEQGSAYEVTTNPQHDYTRQLLAAVL